VYSAQHCGSAILRASVVRKLERCWRFGAVVFQVVFATRDVRLRF